jgi:hypothetical protein
MYSYNDSINFGDLTWQYRGELLEAV